MQATQRLFGAAFFILIILELEETGESFRMNLYNILNIIIEKNNTKRFYK